MKNNIIIIGLLFVIAILALNSIFSWVTLSPEEKLAKEISNPKTDTIKLHYNHDSTIVKYLPNVGQLPANNITKNYRTYVYDTLAPALRIATEDIKELQQVRAKLEGTVKAQKAEIDKEKTKTVYYQDKYFSAKTRTDTLGNSSLDYKYNAQLDIITETKKKNFFSKEIQQITVSSPDKNLKINGVEHIKKETILRPKRIGIGLQVGYGVTGDLKPSLYVGAGISYNIINF